MKYEIGDVVMLKSGGPSMTITNIGDYPDTSPSPGLLCAWFDGRNKFEAVFHPDTVERDD
jgi:uncharacterized protein YodC (DUF2158 family)